MFIFERERAHTCLGGAERGDTESEAGSRLELSAQSPTRGLKLTDREIMT